MNLTSTDFFVFSQQDADGCCNLHRTHCKWAPAFEKRTFMGSFYSSPHAWQYFLTHHPEGRASLCLNCMQQ
ncbi:hypothetical protein PRCB_24325 [Pantoea rodasii]|uniref:Uncharacterized protein n=1 Tax=Pantoea rodasii TaxID=1076549 RepID=A0A2M9W6Q0_9GAMM|nr:hypothetical protein PRCB_24325 [Pantoea rodasii]